MSLCPGSVNQLYRPDGLCQAQGNFASTVSEDARGKRHASPAAEAFRPTQSANAFFIIDKEKQSLCNFEQSISAPRRSCNSD
jgi:hypothetical protein